MRKKGQLNIGDAVVVKDNKMKGVVEVINEDSELYGIRQENAVLYFLGRSDLKLVQSKDEAFEIDAKVREVLKSRMRRVERNLMAAKDQERLEGTFGIRNCMQQKMMLEQALALAKQRAKQRLGVTR